MMLVGIWNYHTNMYNIKVVVDKEVVAASKSGKTYTHNIGILTYGC